MSQAREQQGAIPLQMTKALPKEEAFFRYRGTLDALEGEPAPKPHNKRCQVEDCKHPQFLQSTVGIGAQEERWIFPW